MLLKALKAADIDGRLVHGSWRRLVYGQPAPADGSVDRNAYAFCVLTQFHRHLNRRDIYAPASSRWRDPRALLLDGDAWANAKQPVLSALSLPEDPDGLLAGHARVLDGAYREVAARLKDAAVTVDAQGKLHLGALEAVEEPASLVELRQLVRAMLPRVSVPEVILEVIAWEPRFVEAFAAVSGGRSRLKDLEVTIAACLTAHALNIGFDPITQAGCAGAQARSAQPRRSELHARRDLCGREPVAGRKAGGDPARPGVGWRPGRRDRRNAVRGSDPVDLRPPEPQVLRPRPRRHVAEHDQRPRPPASPARSSPAPRATRCT